MGRRLSSDLCPLTSDPFPTSHFSPLTLHHLPPLPVRGSNALASPSRKRGELLPLKQLASAPLTISHAISLLPSRLSRANLHLRNYRPR